MCGYSGTRIHTRALLLCRLRLLTQRKKFLKNPHLCRPQLMVSYHDDVSFMVQVCSLYTLARTFLASVYEPEPCRIYLATQAFTDNVCCSGQPAWKGLEILPPPPSLCPCSSTWCQPHRASSSDSRYNWTSHSAFSSHSNSSPHPAPPH